MPQRRPPHSVEKMKDETDGARRVDKWLWCTRVVKTRSLGTALAQSGRLRLLRAGLERLRIVKPGFRLAIGDVLTIPSGRDVRVLQVQAFSDIRGSAEIARKLYVELTPSDADQNVASQAGPPLPQERA